LADIRILIADDERVVREALADLVEACNGMTVAAVAADAAEAIAEAARVRPDVALVDVRMPGGGASATREILERCPHTRVLALSASGSRDSVMEMLHAGAAGYLVKGILPIEVINGIRQVAAGEAPISAEVAGGVIERVRAHLDAENQVHQDRQKLVDQLSIALDGDGLDMVYQPIFDLETRTVVGVEALARFSLEPQRRPHEWFKAAAGVGLGIRLEVTALSRALARRSQLPPGVFMAVNLSPEALMSREIHGVVPRGFADRLVIELTEHTPVLDYEALGLAFSPLRAAGAALAIDDAGAGFASLRHILELAPRFIKLDVSITQRIEHDRAALALAVALTSFAGAIDAMIIAEGIESDSHLAALRSLGIRLGQGFHLGRPGPIESLAELVQGDSELLKARTG
jgi:EAL domain-containing protein (putative c-di-GMP-specific phosphodiesterase class I)/ActR/RegA family two-component response regulator